MNLAIQSFDKWKINDLFGDLDVNNINYSASFFSFDGFVCNVTNNDLFYFPFLYKFLTRMFINQIK